MSPLAPTKRRTSRNKKKASKHQLLKALDDLEKQINTWKKASHSLSLKNMNLESVISHIEEFNFDTFVLSKGPLGGTKR